MKWQFGWKCDYNKNNLLEKNEREIRDTCIIEEMV